MSTENSSPSHLINDGVIDTNIEYVHAKNAEKRTPVVSSVFKSVFVEIPKDFFWSIAGFFLRYFRHYWETVKYIHKPSLEVPPFDKKDFKENAQHSFEIALLASAFLIFMIKQGWIPVQRDLQEVYGNDFGQMFIQFFIFIIFAIAYFVLILLSVGLGRLLRLIFKFPISREETDILFAYFNNSLFSIAVILAFIFRCGGHAKEIEDTPYEYLMLGVAYAVSIYVIWRWTSGFARLNNLPNRKLFNAIIIPLFSILYGTAVFMICAFVSGE